MQSNDTVMAMVSKANSSAPLLWKESNERSTLYCSHSIKDIWRIYVDEKTFFPDIVRCA